MNAIAPTQTTPTLRKRRISMAIADFYFKCDRLSSFVTLYRYATSTNTSKLRSPDLGIWAGGEFYAEKKLSRVLIENSVKSNSTGKSNAKENVMASGRSIIDDFHERLFLFVLASTHISIDGKSTHAGSLSENDRELVDRLREGVRLDGRTFPVGVGSDHALLSGFRIIRLLDELGGILQEDFPAALEHEGDSSRIATDEEMRRHEQLTNPTLDLEKLVTFMAIQQRTFYIFLSDNGESDIDHWLGVEQELLAT